MNLSVKEHNFVNTEGECYLGTMTIAGTYFHITAIKVQDDGTGCQEAVDDPAFRLDSLYDWDDRGFFYTVPIDGLSGQFVVVIHPHMD